MHMTMKANVNICQRVFSGIQPTGIPHLGNYFGAIAQWIKLANERQVIIDDKQIECDTPIYSIVDVHAYTSSHTAFGQSLYNNILSTTASLLALGLNTDKCILFRQSDLFEHNYLDNVLSNFVTTQRLTHMIQFKEKSKSSKLNSNALLNYPILQAADILLYRSHLIPVGVDQLQHLELTRDIARNFNKSTCSDLFPEPQPILNNSLHARRIKSLRDPEKKMSKSDMDKKSFIEVIDEPDTIVEKCKKAITDSISEVYYDLDDRPGVSNLIRIYHLTTGDSIEKIKLSFQDSSTAEFKLHLADVLIDKFKGAREEFKLLMADKAHLERVLKEGKLRAQPIAMGTISKVKHLLGSLRE